MATELDADQVATETVTKDGGQGDDKSPKWGSPKAKSVIKKAKDDDAGSEYIVDDPLEIHNWVQDMTKKLYLFWVVLIILASLINAVLILVFRLMDHIYAVDFLNKIFLYGTFNTFGLVGAMLSIIVIAVWGCFSLTTPFLSSKASKIICFFVLEFYIFFCIISQVYQMRGLKRKMESAMMKDMILPNKTKSTPTRLESVSQPYFDCCGVHNYSDWITMGHLNRSRRTDLRGGFPLSCCNRKFPNCGVPVTIYTDESEEIQLWTESCLKAEHLLVILVVGFVLFLECCAFLGSMIAALLLRTVLNHTVTHSVEHLHPFT